MTTWCLSESGVAGPGLAKEYRDELVKDGLGYCAFGLVREGGESWAKEARVSQPRKREQNMEAFAEEGLRFLLEHLENV